MHSAGPLYDRRSAGLARIVATMATIPVIRINPDASLRRELTLPTAALMLGWDGLNQLCQSAVSHLLM
jgi:hypothetical protein